METEWVGYGIPLGSWLMMAGWTIGIFVLGWWFFMPNPMAKDRKDRKRSRNPTVRSLLHLGLRHRQRVRSRARRGTQRQRCWAVRFNPLVGHFHRVGAGLALRRALGTYSEAFIGLEVGVVLSHRILAEITLALLVELSADLPESLDSFEQRRRVLVGTLQRP